MKFMQIKNHLINLEEIVCVAPEFTGIQIIFKNGNQHSIPIGDVEKRDETINRLQFAITHCGTVF